MYCWVENFWKANGYNERVTSYGWEDDDLYWRLQSEQGLQEFELNKDLLHHISGSFKKRIKNQKEFQGTADKDVGPALFKETMENRKACFAQPWKKNEPLKDWDVKEIKKNIFTCIPK
jgi:hypothetical protein